MIDLLLRGGLVYDGLGGDPAPADLAVEGDRVVAVGRDLGEARRVIDVGGLSVAPGFIDPHAHSDMVPLMDEPRFTTRSACSIRPTTPNTGVGSTARPSVSL